MANLQSNKAAGEIGYWCELHQTFMGFVLSSKTTGWVNESGKDNGREDNRWLKTIGWSVDNELRESLCIKAVVW